jgi:hypothetical protein
MPANQLAPVIGNAAHVPLHAVYRLGVASSLWLITRAGILWLDKGHHIAFESDMLLDSLLTIAAIHMEDLFQEDQKLDISINHYLDRSLMKHINSRSLN